MNRACSLLAIALLSACASLPEKARTGLVGTTLPDMLACAGSPEHARQIDRTEWILDYAPGAVSSPSISGAVPVLGDLIKPTLTLSNAQTCHMTVRIRDGRVASVHYVAGSTWLSGPNSACTAQIRDCLKYPDRTVLPGDYDAAAVLKP